MYHEYFFFVCVCVYCYGEISIRIYNEIPSFSTSFNGFYLMKENEKNRIVFQGIGLLDNIGFKRILGICSFLFKW